MLSTLSALPGVTMSNRPCRMTQKWIGSILLVTPLVFICVRFLDVPVALFVKQHLYANARWSSLTSTLPDLLLMVVLLTTVAAFSIYRIRTRKGIRDSATNLAKLITWVAPVSFLAKHVLKFVFGRITTRAWVQDPGLYGFYWFRSDYNGFPSGHMVVVVTLLAALWRFYPRSRPYGLALAGLLAAALVATNYHFLSDVIVGAYLGVLIEAIAFRALIQEPPRLGDSLI